MKKVLLMLLLAVGISSLHAATAVEEALLQKRNYDIAGTFSKHDFTDVADAFDWVFTSHITGKSYQLQGNSPTENDLFGWKEVPISAPTPIWYMFRLDGDIDRDGSTKFDWVMASANTQTPALYKLEGVAQSGNFLYANKLDIDYTIKKTLIQTRTVSSDITWYQPPLGATWQWQLQGDIDMTHDVDIYDIDLFDTNTSVIQALQDDGKKVICYFSAGSYENWREDVKDFPSEVLGKQLSNHATENWLNISSDKLFPIMRARLDLAVEKGCDGVEPDNVEGYRQDTGFDLSAEEQMLYNKFLANEAHKRDLSIALKNCMNHIEELEPFFDFSVNESCHYYDECDLLQPFIDANKPVFNAEYADKYINNIDGSGEQMCSQSQSMQFKTLILPKLLDGSFHMSCDDPLF